MAENDDALPVLRTSDVDLVIGDSVPSFASSPELMAEDTVSIAFSSFS